jgi:hypothetical protein
LEFKPVAAKSDVLPAFDPLQHLPARGATVNPGTRAKLRARQVEHESRLRMELRIREVEAKPFRGTGT